MSYPLTRTFDDIFNSFETNGLFGSTFFKSTEKSAVETNETESVLTLFVPGHNSESLEIETTPSTVSIKSVKEKAYKNALQIDNVFKFSAELYDAEAVTAECKDGILTIVIPRKKQPEKKTGKVLIK